MPTVSVILPNYNSQSWLAQAVQSVLEQTFSDLELIVIDDSSNDHSLDTLKPFHNDSRLKIVTRKSSSGGPATPRNEGLKLASGDYLAFIDSDDVWHPRKLELQVQVMQQHKLNFLSSLRINFSNTMPIPQPIKTLEIQAKNHQQLLRKNWVVTSSALISRHITDNITFDQADEYIGVEDYLVWLRIHQHADIKSGVLMAPLTFYRVRQNSISYSKSAMAAKIFYLLSHYQIKDKPLGLKKYYFFATYAVYSIMSRLTQS